MSEPENIKDEGSSATPTLPPLYLPVDSLTLVNECAATMHKGFAASGEYFIRDGMLVKARQKENGMQLEPVIAAELPSQLEYHFTVMKKGRDNKDRIISKPVNCNAEEASTIWNCKDEAAKHGLPLRLLSNSPVLIEVNGKPQVLGKGYHREEGGIYVLNDLEIPVLTIKEAKDLLLDLFADYNFVSESDLSRAIAHTLSPALKLGNLLGTADFPMDLGLGNQSQVGKTRRMRINAALYMETAYTFTKHEGGVGGNSEAAGSALVSGKLFILIDNVRGKFDCSFIDSVLRGTQAASVRIPHRAAQQVKANRSIWQFTSNGVIVPTDLANRSIIVNINDPAKLKPGEKRKSSAGWDDVTFLHIAKHQGEYLGAVHAIIGEWILQGKPRTNEDRHTFTAWVQSLDFIVQKMLGLKPLLNHHKTSHNVVSDPKFAWLRAVVLEAVKRHPVDKHYSYYAQEFGEISEDRGIDIPTAQGGSIKDIDSRNREIGKILKVLYIDNDVLDVEKYQVERIMAKGLHHDEKKYIINAFDHNDGDASRRK